jgi:hypothetical protein
MIAYGDVSTSLARFAELTHLRTLGLDAGEVHIR